MTDVTQILSQMGQGNPSVAEQLLPLVYGALALANTHLERAMTEKLRNAKSIFSLQ